MQREEAEKLLTQAVDQVIRFDRILLELDVTERAPQPHPSPSRRSP